MFVLAAAPVWVEVTGALAAVVAAVAGAVAAVAAWRSAAASSSTSRDALEALGLAIRPTLYAALTRTQTHTEPARTVFMVSNKETFDAVDIEVEVVRRDGRVVRSSCKLLRGKETQPAEAGIDRFEGDIGDLPDTFDQFQLFDVVFVRYCDARRINQYEQRHEFTTGISPEGHTISSHSSTTRKVK